MYLILLGMAISMSLVQPSNAHSPISVTLLGMLTVVKFPQL